jgi:uncharacterized protein YaeQ
LLHAHLGCAEIVLEGHSRDDSKRRWDAPLGCRDLPRYSARVALQATVRRLKVQLSDVDRSVYESLDLRLAQHPSETDIFLVTRALAYCLLFEPGIEFGHGLSNVDEPALFIKEPDGRVKAWIEVGTPSAERLHRASKAAPRVCIFTQHDPQLILREAARATIHRADAIELYVPAQPLLRALAERVERAMSWELSLSGGQLYVSVGKDTLEGELARLPLVAS